MSETITEKLTADHRRYDQLLALIEEAANRSQWQNTARETRRLAEEMEHHFSFEEEILCSTLESASPVAAGLTEMMRQEHMQIRLLLDELLAATLAGDPEDCAALILKLDALVQQHNAKEEDVLYPLFDRAFGAKWAEQVLSSLADWPAIFGVQGDVHQR